MTTAQAPTAGPFEVHMQGVLAAQRCDAAALELRCRCCRRRRRCRPLTCLPDALLPFPLLRRQGKRFYVQMDGRLEEAPEFAGYPSATEEVQELIGESPGSRSSCCSLCCQAAIERAAAACTSCFQQCANGSRIRTECTTRTPAPAAPTGPAPSHRLTCTRACTPTCCRAVWRHMHQRPA